MCTLTGAQGISTGKYHAAHLTNDQKYEDLAREAGKISGDLTFPLVYSPELQFPEFNSAVADMKNSVADRSNAQSSCAGLFINANLGFDYPGVWLHIDMASPVHCVSFQGRPKAGLSIKIARKVEHIVEVRFRIYPKLYAIG